MTTVTNGHESIVNPPKRGRRIPAAAPAVGSGAPTTARHETVAISPPNHQEIRVEIEGLTPYSQMRFSEKAANAMREKQEAGSTATGKKKRDPKNFEELYKQAMYAGPKGERGIPAEAFRSAMISACRLVGFQMTRAKLAIFPVPDGRDSAQGWSLFYFTRGEPKMVIRPMRNENGSFDLRACPIWEAGWRARVTIRYDADVFTRADVVNLLARAGLQVGVGEGRPDSRNSPGCGQGTFRLLDNDD